MLQALKFNGEENNFFFFSDFHARHNRDFIFGKRRDPFTGEIYKNIDEHDRGIVAAWNSICTDVSIVFHLGDFIFKDPTGEHFEKLVRSLNFQTLYLLPGNHISGYRQIYTRELKKCLPGAANEDNSLNYEIYPLTYNLDGWRQVIFLPQYVEIKINSTYLILCHYPLWAFNGASKSSIQISGHCHSNCKETNKDTGLGFRLDVGVESFGRPISLKEIKYHLRNRKLDLVDHHGN